MTTLKKMDILEAMNVRKSTRGYDGSKSGLTDAEFNHLRTFVDQMPAKTGLLPDNLSTECRWTLDRTPMSVLSTVGVVTGGPASFAGAIKLEDGRRKTYSNIEYGYLMETFILEATAIGLQTCWIGGTYLTGSFSGLFDKFDKESEYIGCVSPVGHGKEHENIMGRFFHWSAGSANRKQWSELFFRDNFSTPLTREDIPKWYETALDNLRAAPSAMNKQDWRVVMTKTDDSKLAFHFYIVHMIPSQFYSYVNIGIAMAHFDLTIAEEDDREAGKWTVLEEGPVSELPGHARYLFSYIEGL